MNYCLCNNLSCECIINFINYYCIKQYFITKSIFTESIRWNAYCKVYKVIPTLINFVKVVITLLKAFDFNQSWLTLIAAIAVVKVVLQFLGRRCVISYLPFSYSGILLITSSNHSFGSMQQAFPWLVNWRWRGIMTRYVESLLG